MERTGNSVLGVGRVLSGFYDWADSSRSSGVAVA